MRWYVELQIECMDEFHHTEQLSCNINNCIDRTYISDNAIDRLDRN